ncbi:hypothetical protein CD201_06385 [Hafnia alvei]|nr:hypothetical protein CD201_06385 [Hafnia alvei]TBL87647.1 hypothetical protein EYY95_10890 [Hafnia alvei]
MIELVSKFCIEHSSSQHAEKYIEIEYSCRNFGQFSSRRGNFLLVLNLPVSVNGVNISKTGN